MLEGSVFWGALLFWSAAGVAFAVSVFASVAVGALYFHSPSRLEEACRDPAQQDRLKAHQPHLDRYLFSASVLSTLSGLVLLLACLLYNRALWYEALQAAAGAGEPIPGSGLGGALLVSVAAIAGIVTLAVVLPRALAEAHADKLLPRMLPYIAWLDRAALPVVYPLHKLHTGVVSLFASPEDHDRIADELRSAALEAEREGFFDEDDASMIESIIEFQDVEVGDIMTPRTEIACLEVTASIDEAIDLITGQGHSRIPVYEESRDRMVGVLYAKDILKKVRGRNGNGNGDEPPLRSLLRKPFFVPATKPIGELLKEFRTRKVHLAVVLDEYGGTAGIATIEDILEEIVGEIEDEYDGPEPRPPIVQVDRATAEVDAKLPIWELNKKLELALPEDGEFDTLGGFVMFRLGKVPDVGESFTDDEVRFTVLDADERRIRHIRIEQLTLAEPRSSSV